MVSGKPPYGAAQRQSFPTGACFALSPVRLRHRLDFTSLSSPFGARRSLEKLSEEIIHQHEDLFGFFTRYRRRHFLSSLAVILIGCRFLRNVKVAVRHVIAPVPDFMRRLFHRLTDQPLRGQVFDLFFQVPASGSPKLRARPSGPEPGGDRRLPATRVCRASCRDPDAPSPELLKRSPNGSATPPSPPSANLLTN